MTGSEVGQTDEGWRRSKENGSRGLDQKYSCYGTRRDRSCTVMESKINN